MHSELKRALSGLLPAPQTLALDPDEEPALRGTGLEMLHVQGRGDRLHGVALWSAQSDADAMPPAAVNWLWLVAPPEAIETRAVQRAADTLQAGVLCWDGVTLTRVHSAPPRPGIFLPRWPALRARWRTLSDW